MLSLLKIRKAQNTMEYAILIAVVVGALSAMQTYLKRGVQAKLKGGSDKIYDVVLNEAGGNAVGILGDDTQYEPYYYRKGVYDMDTESNEGTVTAISGQSGGSISVTAAKSNKRTGEQETTGAEFDGYDEGTQK